MGYGGWRERLVEHVMATAPSLLSTYFLHGLIWAVASTLLVRAPVITAATRNRLWKAALLGPLSSAVIVVLLDTSVREASLMALVAGPSGRAAVGSRAAESMLLPRWLTWAVLGALGGGLVRFIALSRSLRDRLRERRRVADARLLARFNQMAARFGVIGVELNESRRIDSPLVVGPQLVCIQSGGLVALSDAELDSVFAHELAHVERRDFYWFPVAGFLESLFWFYPVTHWVAEQLRRSAELACDDRAVEVTRAPHALAAALARVAVLASSRSLAPSMASSGKPLLFRVRRLLETPGRERESRYAPRVAFVVLLAVFVTTLSLGVKVSSAVPRSTLGADPVRSSLVVDAAHSRSAVDALALNRELAALRQREFEIETALNRAESMALDPENTPQVLELRQERDHVRAAERYTEERLSTSAPR